MRKLFVLLLCLTLFSCKKDKTPEIPKEPEVEVIVPDTVALLSLKMEASLNKGKFSTDIVGQIVKDKIDITVPSFLNNKKFVLTFNAHNAKITVNDTLQESGKTLTDFSKPVSYKLTSAKGTTRTYTISIRNFTNLPILYLTTSGPVTSKDVYVSGSLDVNTNQVAEQTKQHIALEVKGRGNSTWGMPKKPYRLKFKDKAELLGMASAKNWVLLANYSDKTLMRNAIALELGGKLGAAFTPKGLPVELVMNGEHQGSYYLTSQVEVNANRVNIANEGYLLEQDHRETPDFSTKEWTLLIKSPENASAAQKDYIKNYMQTLENVLIEGNLTDPAKSYENYLITETFVNWFIVQEIMKNEDAQKKTSIFYYKDTNGKLGIGPLWDFDISAGNIDYSDSANPTGWWIKDGTVYQHLFKDPKFRDKVKKRWNEVKISGIDAMITSINQNAKYLALSQTENFKKWPILDKHVWPNRDIYYTYGGEVDQLKKWLMERIAWLNTEINKF